MGGFTIFPASLQHIHEGIFLVDRHQLRPKLILRSVQGNGQGNRQLLLGQPVNIWHNAGGGQGYAAIAHAQAVVLVKEPDIGQHIVIIGQRLPGAHNDDGVHLLAFLGQHIVDIVGLGQHLSRCQIPHHAVKGGGTETAAHIAAYLGGNANAVAVRLSHEHCFHSCPIAEAEKELGCLAV